MGIPALQTRRVPVRTLEADRVMTGNFALEWLNFSFNPNIWVLHSGGLNFSGFRHENFNLRVRIPHPLFSQLWSLCQPLPNDRPIKSSECS
jgi:hypothetical protein